MTGERMQYVVAQGIATLTFNRPQVMNALDPEAIAEFCAACERVMTPMRGSWCCAAQGRRFWQAAMWCLSKITLRTFLIG